MDTASKHHCLRFQVSHSGHLTCDIDDVRPVLVYLSEDVHDGEEGEGGGQGAVVQKGEGQQ